MKWSSARKGFMVLALLGIAVGVWSILSEPEPSAPPEGFDRAGCAAAGVRWSTGWASGVRQGRVESLSTEFYEPNRLCVVRFTLTGESAQIVGLILREEKRLMLVWNGDKWTTVDRSRADVGTIMKTCMETLSAGNIYGTPSYNPNMEIGTPAYKAALGDCVRRAAAEGPITDEALKAMLVTIDEMKPPARR